MSRSRLSRRALLRGAGGAAVALPALDIMNGGQRLAFAQTAPKRYLFTFMGSSLGGDADSIPNMFVPEKKGAGYDLKLAIQPLGQAGVTEQVSVVSGLRVPTSGDAGYSGSFHAAVVATMLTGRRNGSDSAPVGTSSDEIVADHPNFKEKTKFRSLRLRVQPKGYTGGPSRVRDSISYNNASKLGMQFSPKAAYQSLFFDLPSTMQDPAAAALRDYTLRSRRSVLDLVRTNTETLVARLGRADQLRIQQHLDEIRDLERRLTQIPSDNAPVCKGPPDPGEDPSLGADVGKDGDSKPIIGTTDAYSDEEKRMVVMTDLTHMALACDLTRVVALQYTMAQSFMNMYPILGYKSDLHQIGHGGAGRPTTKLLSECIAWHVKHFARLVQKLRDTKEGAGTLLDNCAVGFFPEGGGGNTSHTGENMACLIAGRAGGLKAGQHIALSQKHVGNVIIALMNAVGVTTTTFGAVTGNLPELRS